MTYLPYSKGKIAHPSSQSKKQGFSITSQKVMNLALNTAKEHIPITRPESAFYKPDDILSMALCTAAHQTTIEQACLNLQQAPHPNTVRLAVKGADVDQLESQLNACVATSFPKGLLKRPAEVAIDLKLVPYHGETEEGEEDFLVSGEPSQGTTKFFAYASIYLIKKNKRFTLAVKAVRKSEGISGMLKWLLERFEELGGEVKCLYLDRQFYSVKILRFLMEEKNIPFVMPAPNKGKGGGIKGLLSREKLGIYPYEARSPKDGKIGIQIAIAGRYCKGKRGKHQRERYAFVVHCYPFSLGGLFEKYRSRFGIESSHRIWEQARARTASRLVSLRLLLIGLGVLLYNLWVLLRWEVVSIPRQGGRQVLRKRFPFVRLLSLLLRALERRYKCIEAIVIY